MTAKAGPAGEESWAISPWNRSGTEDSPVFSNAPKIADCTLRDGEQQAGLVFSTAAKVELARRLDELGVHDLEIGTPAVSDADRRAIEEIVALGLRAETSALARATTEDVDLVAACGVDAVRISLPIGSRQREAKVRLTDDEYLQRAQEICSYAKSRGLRVIFSPFDTTRCELRFLERVMRTLVGEGCVDRFRMVDTVGAASPEAVRHLVGFMLDAGGGTPIEVHCHDDFGLAVANTLAGALAGSSYLSTTMNGIGERSGNAALEEVVMALRVLYGVDTGIVTEGLTTLSEEVARLSGVALQPHKAIVGRGSFAHESGMVVSGLLKDPFTAEPYRPELVGQRRSIVLGKKAGRASVELRLRELGLTPHEQVIDRVLHEVKERAIANGRGLTDEEFRELATARPRAATRPAASQSTKKR